MEIAIMHIDNRVESLEEARKYLNNAICNNEYVSLRYAGNYVPSTEPDFIKQQSS